MASRIGKRVKILGGMAEFVGSFGEIAGKEGNLYRVELEEAVRVPGVGLVTSDLWEGRMLKTVRAPHRCPLCAAGERHISCGRGW